MSKIAFIIQKVYWFYEYFQKQEVAEREKTIVDMEVQIMYCHTQEMNGNSPSSVAGGFVHEDYWHTTFLIIDCLSEFIIKDGNFQL